MPKVSWQPEISLGNMISVITTIVFITTTWVTLQSDVKAQSSRIDKIEARVAKGEDDDKQRDVVLSTERLRQTEILAEMRADLRYLRAAVETAQRQSTGARQ